MKTTELILKYLIYTAIAFIAIIFLIGAFSCITIKHLPAPCKCDTVIVIEKESPLKFQSMPYYPYPFDHGINPILPFLDTSKATIKLTPNIDTLYKVKALKAQQMTNQ